MRLLFVKDSLVWPRSSGHDVHTAAMMQAMRSAGHEIALMTVEPPSTDALQGLELAHATTFASALMPSDTLPPLTRWQERFRNYWGVPIERCQAVASFAARWRADAVIASGLSVLPYLTGVRGAVRVWYAADDWVWHHLSLIRQPDREALGHVRQAVVKGLYERAYAPAVDRAWAVSDTDALFLRRLAGFRAVDVLPNGVDATRYAPMTADERPESCTFWGRLDFEPNQQAITWFVQQVWAKVLERVPTARFTVYGFQPSPEIEQLLTGPGLELIANRPDIRADICQHAVVVLPFVSGGGIKNKLLEAAALARPVIASARALNGGRRTDDRAFVRAERPSEWVEALVSLWSNMAQRHALGAVARDWVTTHHDWATAARTALAGVEASLAAQ